MKEFLVGILLLAGFFTVVICFILLLKRFGGFSRWEVSYSEIKQSAKAIKTSKTKAICLCREEFCEPKDTNYGMFSGHSHGLLSGIIIFKETGLLINSTTSPTYGIQYADVENVEVRILTGIHSAVLSYRVSLYSSNGIKETLHIATTRRCLTFINTVFKDKVNFV